MAPRRDATWPTVAEVKAWGVKAGIPERFTEGHIADADERGMWFSKGRLIDWQSRLARQWRDNKGWWLAREAKRGLAGDPAGGVSAAEKKKIRLEVLSQWADSLPNGPETVAANNDLRVGMGMQPVTELGILIAHS